MSSKNEEREEERMKILTGTGERGYHAKGFYLNLDLRILFVYSFLASYLDIL